MAITTNLERYRHITTLGSGGMSTVILAEDTLLGRRVALKRLHPMQDTRGVSRLRREALIGASVSHPNLVPIYDIITLEGGEQVIVMEYVDGETLRDLVRREGRLDTARALHILDGVAAALDAIHAQGIVHRDVKPANILLGRDGTVKLADLGVASAPDRTRITTEGGLVGTFSYMAPEQLGGAQATSAADVYALAAVAFEALSGRKARTEPNPLALAHAIATSPPADLRTVWSQAPASAAKLLTRGMSRNPKDRPKSAGELTARLREALAPAAAAAAAPPSKPRPKSRPRRAAAAAAAPVAASASAPARAATGKRAAPAPAQVPASATVATTGTGAEKRAASPQKPEHDDPRRRRLIAAAALIPLLIVAAVIAAIATSGGSPSRHSAGAAARSRTTAAGTTTHAGASPSHRTSSSAATGSHPSAAGSSSAGSAAVAPPGTTSPAGASVAASGPVSAVERFYTLAAAHDYPAAWALADSSFRSQLGGYRSFESTMAASRSITFNSARTVSQSGGAATVAVQTTSYRTSGTQHCSGTVQLVPAGGAWMLHQIGVSCV